MERSGGCGCGKVRFTVRGEPKRVGLCHCPRLPQAAWGPFMAFAVFERTDTATFGEMGRFERPAGLRPLLLHALRLARHGRRRRHIRAGYITAASTNPASGRRIRALGPSGVSPGWERCRVCAPIIRAIVRGREPRARCGVAPGHALHPHPNPRRPGLTCTARCSSWPPGCSASPMAGRCNGCPMLAGAGTLVVSLPDRLRAVPAALDLPADAPRLDVVAGLALAWEPTWSATR
jgi:hypothetical protein